MCRPRALQSPERRPPTCWRRRPRSSTREKRSASSPGAARSARATSLRTSQICSPHPWRKRCSAKPRKNRKFLEAAQDGVKKWRDDLAEQGALRGMPMKPQVVAFEANKLLREDAVVTTDSGTNTAWAARYLDMRGDMMFSLSGNLASMACGLPYANAAALAFPDRQVVAFVGDGGLSMLMAEL